MSKSSLLQFRYSDGFDILLLVVGSLTALASGTGMPLMIILFGDLLNTFVGEHGANSGRLEEFKQKHPECFDNGT